MKSGSGKRNLLLAATIVSLSVTMPMNVAYADDPTPTRGANATYTITDGTTDNHNFTTSDGSTTSYYKTNLSVFNLLNNINSSTAWLEGTQDSNNFSVVLPNNEIRYFIYGYTKPDGWGDGERQAYDYNDNAAGNSAFYNNRTFNGLNSTVSGGAIDIQAKYQATTGSNLVGTMTADFVNNSITNTDTSEKGLGGALHIWGPYAGIETLNSNFINNHITYGTAKSGGGALAIGEGWNGGDATVGLINGNFINNYIDAPSNNFGGAIYYEGSSYGDGEITSIGQDPLHTTKFVGNHILGTGQGGAIYAVNKIGSIYADFIGNYIAGSYDSSKGGAIALSSTSDEKNVGLIVGDFIGNYITTSANNGTAYGGAIYNNNIVGSITGDFIGNYVVSEQDATYGGAVYNTGTITNLTGNFIGNYANGKAVYGGAIHNKGTITNLNGKFIENDVYSNAPLGFQTDGGAIANTDNGIIENISGDFIRNKAHTYDTSRTSMMVSGGAIYNDGAKIGTINANFIENESQREAGAIYNSGYASSNKGIGTISGNFIKNKVTGEIARDTYGGAISNTGTIDSITDATFSNNSVASANGKNGYGGAIYNSYMIGEDNGYGFVDFSTGIIDSSFTGNTASTAGGAIYNTANAKGLNIIANTENVEFSGNIAPTGASIYNLSADGTNITATGGNVTFTNNTPTNSQGYGIYSSASVNLAANDGYTVKIDDSIDIVNQYADLTINQGNFTGNVELNGKINFENSNSGIRVGFAGFDSGTLKLGATPANGTYQYLVNAGNYTLDLQNEHAGDNLILSQLSGIGEMKFNIDYDATANSMDKITVNAGSGTITLNAINVINDNANFVDGTTAEYLDGTARGNITVISDAINSATDTGWLYVFTPTSTNGELSIARAIAYEGDLINAIQDDLGGTYHPTSFSLSDNFTANRNFGALSTENRDEFTIFGNNHTISGDNNTYTGIEVASGQTLNLDNVRFSNVKTYDVQNAGTLNLSGTNTINTITGATGNTNITGGTTTIANGGSITQSEINLKGGRLVTDSHVNIGTEIKADINNHVDYVVAGSSRGGVIDNYGSYGSLGTISGTFKDNSFTSGETARGGVIYNYNTIDSITADFDGNTMLASTDGYGGAIYNRGIIKSISGDFTNNTNGKTTEQYTDAYKGGAIYNVTASGVIGNIVGGVFVGDSITGTFSGNIAGLGGAIYNAYDYYDGRAQIGNIAANFTNNRAMSGAGGAIWNKGDIQSITNSTFIGNSATSSSDNAYGGAIYQSGGTLTISGATFDGNSVEGSSGGSGGAIYSNGTALTITGTAENPTVFKNNGISKYDNNYQGSADGGVIYQTGGTLNISNTKFENNVSDFNIKSSLYGGAIYANATGGDISADFTGNTLSATAVNSLGIGGGAIYNEGTLTKITGDFTNNAITLQPTSSSEQYGESSGGAIANGGTITNGIDGTFSGNTITTNVKQSDANGGAIANGGTIGNITGDFLNNSVASTNTTYSGSARGGAIYNLNGTIGNIIATSAEENGFKGNSATKAAGYNAEGLGGAIYNHAEGYNATIGNITADFINNTATTNGGAIYNYAADNNKAEIGNIIGNFTGNTASQGSAIYNKVKNDESYINNKLAKIGDITGNFTENAGTVIYNEGYYDFNNFNEIVYAQIGDITGNFAENSASSGNVIFNNYGKIGDITGDFTENTTNNGVINNRGSIDSITANTTTHKGFYKNTGGAVRNESSADYHRNATIGNITADFKENSAVSYGGGAIYNTGSNASAKAKIGDITGDFDKNTSKNYGGAIYNNYSIIGAQNNLGEFTGTAITGDFTYNQVDNNSVYNSIGGAIANENSSAIGNIQGNFENNSIIDSRYKAMGGAIANRTSSKIGNITGNFNANSISYNPIFDTDTFEAQHYGNSSLGGAIYNDSTSTIGTLTGDFVGNRAKGHVAEDDTTTVFAAAGGAIFNEGTLGTITGDIKNNYALGHSHHGVYGGAIYTTTGLNLVDSDITGNYVTTQSTSATDLKGGAIYTTDGINITASTKDISVSGNYGTEQGAAIYNSSENNAVVLNATGRNITFENNNLTGLANGSGVGIYSAGGLTLNAADGKYIALNDALNITGNTTLNGTLKLGDYAVETLANTTSKFIAQGGTLDIANGAVDNMAFTNAVDIQNAINLGIDVNLTGTTATADKITADYTSGSAITLSALNFINDNYTGSEEDHNLTIADGTIKSLINQNITSTTGNTNTYTYSYDNTTGILTVSLVTYDNIYDAVHDSEKATRTYKIKLAEGETVTQALGALAGTSLTVNGNNKYLDGTVGGVKVGGFIVADGQTLTLKDISSLKNFTTAVDNAGTLNVENVTFTGNTTDINNTATLNLSGNNEIKTITGATGNTNINGGATWIKGGSVTQNTINLKGGDLVLDLSTSLPLTPGTITANIVGDGTVEKTGIILNSGTINGTISGTFKGNNNTALANYGTVGNITADFVNNTATVLSSNAKGGAIYNEGGTLGTISGNFTGNSATSSSGDAYGGAIYQNGGTLTISGSTFGGSEAGQGNTATTTASGKSSYGGAIYLTNATATITDSTFENNSAMWGGAIYQNSGSLTLNNATFKNNTGNIGSSIYQKSGTLSITDSTFDNTNSGNLWQESGNLSITDSNFTNTDVTSRLGSNVTISGSTFDNSPVHFMGNNINNGYDTLTNTFSITNSTIENTAWSGYNAYALSVVGGDVTIDGVNIINNTNAKAIKSEAAAQGTQDHTHYSNINIIAQAADVNITGNKYGVYVTGWNDNNKHTTLTMYAKNHDILISENTSGGINYYDDYGILTLNADTDHNITINDAIASTTGMTVNAGGTHAGTVALNGALTLGSALNVNGGTLTLNDTAASSMANKDLVLNGGALKLDSVAAAAIVNTNLGLNGGKFDIANNAIDNLTFTNAINNAVNSYIALDVSLGDTNTADKITSDISGASTINVSDINFISDNKNGGEVQIADGNIKSVITVSDVAGGYADVQYNNSTGILSFADKINWLEQTNGNQSGYRFTKTNNGIMPVNYTSGENNYTFYTDILKKNYTDDNSVAHDLKYTWNNATHTLSVTNSDDTALSTTKSTIVITGDGSSAAPYVYTGDHIGNTAIGLNRWNNFGDITGDFVGNTNGAIAMGMGVSIPSITGNFIGNSGGRAFSFSGDHSWGSSVSRITGDFIGNANGAIYISNWNNGGIGTVTGDFIGNKADGDAGAIWLADGYINSLTGNFINNYAGVDAGALLVGGGHNGANITVIGDFIGNQAVDQGGAIYNWSGATTRLIDSSFIGNIASEGAAIYIDNGELSVTALNKDIEFTNNNSTGTAGGDGYGIYHKSSGYRPFALNAYEGRTITVNDKVYSEQKINLNCYYSGDWVGKNGTIIFNNEFTQTGATEISSNESNAGGGTVIFNGTTSLDALDVSGTATLKLGAGAGTSTFGAVTFTRNPILDIANNSAQTLNVASIKGNSKLNIDLDFTGDSVLADAINITTGGQTGVLTLDSINALTSETGAIRSFSELEILKGTTTNVTLALSETLQQDERFFGDEVESVTREVSTFADNATFGQFEDNKFTDTVYAHKTQNRLYLDDTKTKLSFDSVETAAEYVKSSTSQDVLQSLNQSTSATRSLTTDDATKTYTAGADLGATGTGSLTVSGTTSGENTSTLNMNGRSGFELSNSDTTLALSNLNIIGVKDIDGGLINITGTGSKANLENVTITSTTNSAISNAVELNLNGTNNLGTGITGTGTTNVNGGKTTIGSITQNAVNIVAGELEAANITTTSGISNAGTLTLTGTANGNNISGVGTTVIKNNLNNTGTINQAVEIANTGNLTTTADKLGGTITNAGTLNLSGSLNKAISGAGTTKVNSALTFLSSTDLSTGTLDLNNGTLTLSGDSAATEYTVNSLTGSGSINIDIDYSSATPVADSIRIATGGGTGTVTVDSITPIGTVSDSFSVDILTGNTTGLTLAISETLANQYKGDEVTDITHETEAYQANIDFDKKSFDTVEYTQKSQKTLSVNGNKLDLAVVITEAKHETGRTSEDALATLNTTAGSRSMKATTAESSNAYKLTKDLGNTATGDITVEGRSSSDLGQLDMDGKTGFNIANAGTTVNLKNLNITNTKAEDGSLINITNSSSSANLEGVTVASNTSNVISSNGTLGVTNSTVNAGVNNNGTMNLNGTNQIASVEGSNGTANVQAGTTTVGSIFQKLINIVTGGKLASNGDVTATNGITNDTANGLSVANGTLTGNVTGSGSTDFKGTSAIADGSTVGQAITIVDGKLTTLADGLGGAVTNGGEVDLTGGTLETSITGGNTTISGNVGVDDTLGSIASDVKVETGAKLTTNADKVTGAINNGGNLDLTGGDIKNDISGSGNTTISGAVTNTTGSEIGNAITVASTGDLTTAANFIGGAVQNGGTVQLDGGTLSQTITGGNIAIIDDVDTNASNLAGATTVAGSKELTLTGGNVNSNISGAGNTKITGTVNNNANISTAAEVNGGALDNTNGQLADVTVTSGSLKSNADNVGAVANNGTYEITGGTIASGNGISGNGDINITGNVINNATNTTTGAVTVGAGNELKIGATGDVFGSASSVTMGDNSTLNLQNGSAVATNINNVVVGADDTLNLALDWGDQVNTTNPSNIAGNLQISSVDLTGTDGSKQTYQITTTDGLKDKISVKDPLDIQGTGTSNFVKYNDRATSANYGQLTTYQNSLFMAVTDTEAGEIATYNMTADETAGGGELDGTLKVQGNGNSITTAGVVIGSTTIQNAELTLEDANMRNITGDAITVYGGNKGHIVAKNHDVAITANTGNAIKLIANGTNYAEMDVDAGSKTITIDNDIVSDDSHNKVTFKGGNVQFNGKFDPAMGVVDGSTVTRSGADTGIDWTLTSGTLYYTNDSYLNNSTNSVTFNGGNLDTRNGVVTTFNLANMTLNASTNSNFYADVDLANKTMDNFGTTPVVDNGGKLHVAGLNLISDAADVNTSINFTSDPVLMAAVDYTGAQGLTALSPIYKYNVGYDSSNGNFDFTRYNSGGYDGLNPAIMAAPVAAQLGGYLTQLNSYDEAFRNMDMYMLMTAQQRQALKNKNKVASIDGGVLYDQTLMRQERAEGWFRPFATFEKVPLKNGPKVENIAYGTYMGGESQMYDLGHGWDGIWGAYVGYNGSHQNYDGVSIYQNGGTLGVLGMAYKGNFFTGLTINAGASGVEASTMYGNEDFAMLMAGIASKTGYNWELFNGKFIIQPSMLMSYSFVNTFDYRNAAGVKVDSDPLHAIQLQPEIKFIGNLKNGWQPYASVAMVWNIMDDTKFKANDVSLPELSVKPYVKYGVGVRKTWGERLTGFFQTYLTNGGRNGVGLQAGFTWAFGGGKDKKADEKKIQKSLNKTPELKKTEIVLNGKKVQ